MSTRKNFIAAGATSLLMGAAFQTATGAPSWGDVSRAIMPEEKSGSVTFNVSDLEAMNGFDRLKIAGYVTPDSSEPVSGDWNDVRFTGKNGVNGINDVTDEIASRIDREFSETVTDIAEMDWIAYSGSPAEAWSKSIGFDDGYGLDDHVRAVVNVGPEGARAILRAVSDGDIAAETARGYTTKMIDVRLDTGGMDVEGTVASRNHMSEASVMRDMIGEVSPAVHESNERVSSAIRDNAERRIMNESSDMTRDIMNSVLDRRLDGAEWHPEDEAENEAPAMDL